MSSSLVAYGSSSESESEEGPEQSARRQPVASAKDDVRKLLSVLPPARRRGGSSAKQPVRIGLPTLEAEVERYREGVSENSCVYQDFVLGA